MINTHTCRVLKALFDMTLFLSCLKVANVVAFHKQGIFTDPKSYRPVKILNSLYEILHIMVKVGMEIIFTKNVFLCSGYLKKFFRDTIG